MHSFIISLDGNLYKCTVTRNDETAKVGHIVTGIERNKYYYKWLNSKLSKKNDKCFFCKRNLSEIKEIINYKVDKMIKNSVKLVELKDCINNDLYQMYQDIPLKETGSTNKLYEVNYDKFKAICEDMIKEETVINEEINTTTKRFILLVNSKPVGEVGIRTTLNDFWINKGSQIYYKVRKSERGKGYGNVILKFALEKAKEMNFNKIRINCDNNNIPSKKIIIKNGGRIDISNYKTKEGYSSSYIIDINEK